MEFKEYSLILPDNIKNEINNINIQPLINFISSESRSIKNETELELTLITIRKVKKLLIDNLITNYKITDDQIKNMFKNITEKTITGTKHITGGRGDDDHDRMVKRFYIAKAGLILMKLCPGQDSPIERIICLFGSLILICCLLEMITTYLLETLKTLKTPEYIKNITHFLRQLFQIDNVPVVQDEFPNIDNVPDIPVADDVTNQQPDCAICHEPFAIGREMSQLPCSHVYHTNCIMTWLSWRRNCPICRAELYGNAPAVIELVLSDNQPMPNQPMPNQPIEGFPELQVQGSRPTTKTRIINVLKKALIFISFNRITFRRTASTGGKTKKKRNKKSYTRQKKGNIKNHRKSKRSRRRSRR